MDTHFAELETLLTNLTANNHETLPEQLATKLADHCRHYQNSYKEIYRLYEFLYTRLQNQHGQVRYSSFLVFDYLFLRSLAFRHAAFRNLTGLISQCLGLKFIIYGQKPVLKNRTQFDHPRVLPKIWTKRLHSRFLDSFQKWNQTFGQTLPLLDSFYKIFIEQKLYEQPKLPPPVNEATEKKYDKSGLRLVSVTNNPATVATDRTLDPIHQVVIDLVKKHYDDLERDVNLLLIQINGCFELLIPKINLDQSADSKVPATANQTVDYRPMSGLSFDITLKRSVNIVRDHNNSVVIDNLTELCRELTAFRAKLEKFNKHLDMVAQHETITAQRLQAKIAFLDRKINSVLAKQKDICFITTPESSTGDPKNSDDDDDDADFEEVNPKEQESEQQILLRELVKAEPMTDRPSPPPEVEGQCRARLPSGRLCPRRDRDKCVFHGPIIKRDADGWPVDAEKRAAEQERERQRKADEWKDPQYLRTLSEQVGVDLTGRQRNPIVNNDGLINIRRLVDTPRERLKKRFKLE